MKLLVKISMKNKSGYSYTRSYQYPTYDNQEPLTDTGEEFPESWNNYLKEIAKRVRVNMNELFFEKARNHMYDYTFSADLSGLLPIYQLALIEFLNPIMQSFGVGVRETQPDTKIPKKLKGKKRKTK